MKPKKHFRGTALVKLIALSLSSSFGVTAHAATWDGAVDGVWDMSTTANWTGSTFTSGDDAVFTGTPTNNVTTATGLTIGAITLNSDFTGSVSMTGDNTVTGATTISGGTLAVLHTGATTGGVTATDLGTSAITVNSGGTFMVDDTGNGTTGAERILSLGNTISGVGIINAKASALHTNGWSSINFTGDLSGFTGTLNIVTPSTANRGKVKFTTATTQAKVLSSSATVNVQNGAQLYLTEALNYGFGIHLNGGTGGENFGSLRLDNASLDVTGALTLHADSNISGSGKISGAIGETGGSYRLTKVANNTTVLTGPNTYSGTTTISAGTVSVGHNNALGTGAVTMGGGNLSNTAGVTLANNFTLNNGTTFTAGSGTMTLNGNITGSPNGGWTLAPTNKITLGGTNSPTLSGNFAGFIINAGAGGVDITGTTTISGAAGNTFSGYLSVSGNVAVTVQSGGSLAINGTSNASKPGSIVGQNAAGTSTLTVNGGAFTIGANTEFGLGNNVASATGVLTVSSGTATITAGSATLQNSLNFVALGRDAATGIINLDGGTLATGRQFVRDGSSGGTAGSGTATFNFNGGTLQAQADQTSGNGWFETATTGNFQVVTTTVKAGGAVIDTNGFNANISTVLAHDSGLGDTPDGGLTKSGAGTLTLTGTNTYTGDTTVTAGVLAVNGNAIADANKLVIDGGKVNVTGTEVVGTLFFGGVQQANGLWGSSSSSAPPANQDDSRFSGTGVVSVGPASGYSTWATDNVGGQTADQDFNNDGVDNGIAYFMNDTGMISLPGIVGGAITWTNGGNIPASAYGDQFVVQTSPDLVIWAPVDSVNLDANEDGPAGSLTYTLTTGEGKFFVRLVVTPD